MKYLIAIKTDNDNEIFEFKTEKEREMFIYVIEKMGAEWATSEIEES